MTYSEDTIINYSNEISKQSDAVAWLTGATTADLIVPTTANALHYFGYHLPYSAGTSNETYSFFAKAAGYHRFRVYLANQGGSYQADFDLSAETATNAGTAVGQSIENFGGGWFRCSMTFLSTKINPYPAVKIFDNAGNETFSGDGASGIYFVGHQLEASSTASSYIPTSGATVTRAAQSLTVSAPQFGWPTPEYIGPELVTNGTFDTDLSGWTDSSTGTGTVTVNGSNQVELYRADVSNRGIISQDITFWFWINLCSAQ